MVSVTRFALAAFALTAPVTARRHRVLCSASSESAAAAAAAAEATSTNHYAPDAVSTSQAIATTTQAAASSSTMTTTESTLETFKTTYVPISKSTHTTTSTSGVKVAGLKTAKTRSSTTFQTKYASTFTTSTTTNSIPAKVQTTSTLVGGVYAVTPTANAVTPTANAVADTASLFKPGVTWDICLSYPIKHDSVNVIPEAAKVWDIDLGHAQEYPTLIPMLKKAGKFVICYFNAGAVQAWDTDAKDFSSMVIGNSLGGPYSDEHYLDIRSSAVLGLMKKRLDAAVKVGCDAVDPDNTDAWVMNGNDRTGFALTATDYVNYLTKMADYAHSLKTQAGGRLLVGQKNAADNAKVLASKLDFAVLEECRGAPNTADTPFCADFQVYIDMGKPVLQIEYPPSVSESDGTLSSSDHSYYCKDEPQDNDFSKVLKWASAQLDGWGEYCSGGGSFRTPQMINGY